MNISQTRDFGKFRIKSLNMDNKNIPRIIAGQKIGLM
jgi:hypothetical protein